MPPEGLVGDGLSRSLLCCVLAHCFADIYVRRLHRGAMKTFYRNLCLTSAFFYVGTVAIVIAQFCLAGVEAEGRDVFFLCVTVASTLLWARVSDDSS